jgi:drug/metabolite transporter (DMT)-like permease
MMWLIVTLIAYLILAVVFLADKYILTEEIPNPKLFAFYSGLSGFLIIVLIPFVDFEIFSLYYIFISIISGSSFFIALFLFYKALKMFEVSRVVPAVGALIPLFSLIFAFIFSRGEEFLKSYEVISLFLLIIGSFLISHEPQKKISTKSLFYSSLASAFFSLYFISTKYIYNEYSFLSSLIWIKLGGFLMSLLFFLFFKDIREELFVKKETLNKKAASIFFGSKIFSGIGGLLQSYSIFLAPSLAVVAIINGLQGIQYAFLLVIVIFLSLKYPKIIKEEISKKIIIQKSFSILLILIGLFIISFINY